MRFAHKTILAYALSPGLFLSLQTFLLAQGVRSTTVGLRPYPGPMLIVPVEINGHGPYDFVLDTGSTITILETPLFREVGLKQEEQGELTSPVRSNAECRGTAREVMVNGLAVVYLKIAGVDKLNLDSPYGRVRGILGENFLDQFDLLIDNQNRQITLDATANLANSYDGDHLEVIPISQFSGKPLTHRPIVTVTVPSYSSRPLRLVLDTGAAALAIFPHRPMGGNFSNGGHARLIYGSTPNGNLPCAAWKDTIHWDKSTVRGVDILSCPSAIAEKLDNDGSMPTHLFAQVLLVHSAMYVVLNPVRHAERKENTMQAHLRR
jgi:predicted aspartyl protease